MQTIDVGKNGNSGAVAWFGGSGMSLRGTAAGLRVRGFGHVSAGNGSGAAGSGVRACLCGAALAALRRSLAPPFLCPLSPLPPPRCRSPPFLCPLSSLHATAPLFPFWCCDRMADRQIGSKSLKMCVILAQNKVWSEKFWLCHLPYSSTAVEMPPQKGCYTYLHRGFGYFVGCVF